MDEGNVVLSQLVLFNLRNRLLELVIAEIKCPVADIPQIRNQLVVVLVGQICPLEIAI